MMFNNNLQECTGSTCIWRTSFYPGGWIACCHGGCWSGPERWVTYPWQLSSNKTASVINTCVLPQAWCLDQSVTPSNIIHSHRQNCYCSTQCPQLNRLHHVCGQQHSKGSPRLVFWPPIIVTCMYQYYVKGIALCFQCSLQATGSY